MNYKALGLILVCLGAGMLMAIFIPWWGCIAASIMVICGVLLIINGKC